MASIVVFVSVRLSEPANEAFTLALEQRVLLEEGCPVDAPEGMAFAANFGRLTAALKFTRHVHDSLGRENRQSGVEAEVSVGIECGELPAGPTKRIEPLERSAELADLANFGQNLIGPAAREIARQILPGGFMLVDLGEIRLGNSITADRVCQLSLNGYPDDFPHIEALDEVSSNVADMTSDFIGRDKESRELRRLLNDNRLVSIAGPAGVGKSSLAHWLAFDLAEAYRDGAWKVDLAKIPAGGNVATAIAADLKLPMLQNHSAEDRVKVSLSTMHGLIWLDNCEHVLKEARDLVPRILKCCPKVTFLVTSRMKLRLKEEAVLELRTFEVPTNPDDYGDSEAVRLFLNRAKTANPDLTFAPSDLATIAEICRRVDGLPLAIELVAAQVARQPVTDLLARLSDAMRAPLTDVPARHRTLERALSWSYSLLTEKERKFFRYLGVLSGPTNRDLAIAAGSAGRAWLEQDAATLDTLVAASLVQESHPRGPRSYRLLEPVRQFAIDQLERQEELRAAKTKFAKACLDWLNRLKESRITGHKWVSLVDRERANLEASLEWSLQEPRGGKDALTMCVELYDYWILKGPYDSAHTWYQRALAAGKSTPAADVADIYNWMGLFAGYAGRYEDSKKAFYKSIELHEKAGRPARVATALQNLSIHLMNCNELELALQEAIRCLELTPRDDENLSMRTGNLAWYFAELGHVEESRRYLEQAISLNETADEPWARACHQSQLAHLALLENHTQAAEDHIRQALESYRECGNVQGLVGTFETAGFLALRMGNIERAAKLLAGAERHFLGAGVGRPPRSQAKRDVALTDIEDAVGVEQAEALYAVGAILGMEELFEMVRSGCAI